MNASYGDRKSVGVAASPVSSQLARAFRWASCLQILIVLILLFGDIGFDVPGRFGLDFGHLLLLLLGDFILIVWAVSIAIRARSWLYAGVQMLLLAVAALGVFV